MSDGDENTKRDLPSGFDKLGKDARLDLRMLTEERPPTAEETQALIGEFKDYRRDHSVGGRPLSWKKLAELLSDGKTNVAHSTLTEVINGKYRADPAKVLRLIDKFLADERSRAGGFDIRQHAEIGLTRIFNGVIRTVIRNHGMGALLAKPGVGKSVTARAFAAERGGVVLIVADETNCDSRGVSLLFCQAIAGLRNMLQKSHRKRLAAVLQYLCTHRNTVVIIDECQQLTGQGLECLRNLHDKSDPEGRRCTPMILFGDTDFYRLLLKSRAGEKSPISPQLTRRIWPIYDATRESDDDTGDLFSVEDVVRIIRNDRLRVVTPDGVRWITRLANVDGWGAIGFAVAVLRIAFDIRSQRSSPVTVDDLRAALRMTVGSKMSVEEIDDAADGALLQRTG